MLFLGVEVDEEDEVGGVGFEGGLDGVVNFGVGVDGAFALDAGPGGGGAGAPGAGGGGGIPEQRAVVAFLEMEIMRGAMGEVGEVLGIEIVDLELHAKVFGLDGHCCAP